MAAAPDGASKPGLYPGLAATAPPAATAPAAAAPLLGGGAPIIGDIPTPGVAAMPGTDKGEPVYRWG